MAKQYSLAQLKTKARMCRTQEAALKLISEQPLQNIQALNASNEAFAALLPNNWSSYCTLDQSEVEDARAAFGMGAPTPQPQAAEAVAAFVAGDPTDGAMVAAKKLTDAAWGAKASAATWTQARQKVVFAALAIAGEIA